MAPFAGWEMPIQFSGLINEHQSVREKVGLFDISHMGVFLIEGLKAKDALQNLVPTDLYRIGSGEACYTLLLNEYGGIIDDLIIYDLGPSQENLDSLLIVINAGCIEKDIRWIKQNLEVKNLQISDFKNDGILIAVQGPEALDKLDNLFEESISSIPRFGHKFINFKKTSAPNSSPIFCARTGYTGEDGFEILLTAGTGREVWNHLVSADITPCGLGARDTLRLEAGMHLYGNELNTQTTPFEAGLGWLVNLEMTADFIGRTALEKQVEEGLKKKLVGLKVHGRAIARKGYKLYKNNKHIGEVTSGTWSPSLKEGIAMGYVPPELSALGTTIDIEIRGTQHQASIVKRPFYKKQK